ncbi:MAG: NHL repeat-containing protein [Acidobacteriaceae bacterium]
MDSYGNAYIVDNDHKSRFRVLKVSSEGKQLDEWRVFPVVEGRSGGPDGIAMDFQGNILVTDNGKLRVLKLSPEGKLLMSIGGDAPLFHDLGHVAADSKGNIYVAEGGQHRIQKFSSTGKRIAVWQGPQGRVSGAEEWKMPETIVSRSDDSLVVDDWGNRRIVVLSPNGHVRFIINRTESRSDAGICVDRTGDIYALDWKQHLIRKFDPKGRPVSTISDSERNVLFTEDPSSLAVDAAGNFYAADGLSIVKFSPQGKLLARWR